MTWREKTLIRILLFVARIVAPDTFRSEVQNLANHISVHAPEVE